jgi:hypothetical protein
MRYVSVVALGAVLAAAPAGYAQESGESQASEPAPQHQAVPRSSVTRSEGTSRQPSGEAPAARSGPVQRWPGPTRESAPPPSSSEIRPAAEQGGSRARGDNPQTGSAVPRGSVPAPVGHIPTPRYQAPPRIDTPPGRVSPRLYNYYYYPRAYYPYGYGAFGLGYFYYDPYSWGRVYGSAPGYYSGYSTYSASPLYNRSFGFDVGELRLRVDPPQSQVFVDGYYAGVVDDYDGTFQGLKLDAGVYHIMIVRPGYEPLEFDVRISRGQKITYRGELRRLRP